jgi:ribose 5-phosphate isomerase A
VESNSLQLKQQAALAAVQYIESGMIVGLGHGSTAIWVTHYLAEYLRAGKLRNVLGIPCSRQIEAEAQKLGVPLTTLEEHPVIDITIDGADEIAPSLDLIKGGGGALTREKIVAQASKRKIIVADESKLVPALGTGWAVPVEVIPFGHGSQMAYLRSLGAQITIRANADGGRFLTDQGNLILDCRFGPITNPAQLAEQLKRRTGIVEHGLFIGLATEAIVVGAAGIRHIKPDHMSG